MTITRADLDAGLVDFADTAAQLAAELGSPDLWLGLQEAYELALARERGTGAKVRTLSP